MNDERQRAAQAVLAIPLVYELFAEIEQAAVNACVYAEYDDHIARQSHAAEVRAIRKLKGKLEAIASEGQSTPVRKSLA